MTRVLERSRRTATLVLRPMDALAAARLHPPFQRGPVRPVGFRIAGRVLGGVVEPIPGGAPPAVRNLSGDTVFIDLRLGAGRYRIELEPGPTGPTGIYQEVLPLERNVDWNPAMPLSGIPGLPGHPSRLVEIHLHPGEAYPFPTGITLIRGGLVWYDNTALDGALVRAPGTLLLEARVGPRGDFVVIPAALTATGVAALTLDTSQVDGSSRPDALGYLAAFPATWPAPWQRGTTSSLTQPGLTGLVRRADGRVLDGAIVRPLGRPGFARTDGSGRWTYRFPPRTAAGSVDLRVEHPDHAPVTLAGIAFPADATATVPVIVLS
jgi:hypothetical protein